MLRKKTFLLVGSIVIIAARLLSQPLATCADLELASGAFTPPWRASYGKWNETNNPCGIKYSSSFLGFNPVRHRIRKPADGIVLCYGNNTVPYVPPGHNFAIQLGNDDDGREWERLETSFKVSQENSLIEISLALFFEDHGHNPCDQPRFWVKVLDENGALVSCGNYQVIAAGNLPGWGNSYCSGYSDPIRFLPWTKMSVDLRKHLGKNVTLQFQSMDCSESGHFGFALFALRCLKSEITAGKYCPGIDSVLVLKAPDGYGGYQWNNGSTAQTITVAQPLPGQTFSVALQPYSNLNGSCQIEMEYTVMPPPVIQVTPDTFFCDANGINLVASVSDTNYSMKWSTGASAASIPVNTPGVYTVTATGNSCVYTREVVVEKQQNPQVQTLVNDAPCYAALGQASVNPTAPNANYAYAWSSGQTGPLQALPAGQYTVSVTNLEGGCQTIESVAIHEPPQPLLTTTASVVKCSEQTVELRASGDFVQFDWTDGQQGDIISVGQPGQYSVVAKDAKGCTVVSPPIIISNYPIPNATISGDSLVCPGGLSTLSAEPGMSYAWSANAGSFQSVVVPAGAYFLTVTDAQGCTNTGSFNIHELAAPIAWLSTDKVRICKPETALLTVTADKPILSYQWNQPTAQGNQFETLEGGYFEVVVTDTDGCKDTVSLSVPAYDYLAPVITGKMDICAGQSASVLNAYMPDAIRYEWLPPVSDTTAEIVVHAGGNYTVVVEYAYGCSASTTVSIIEHTPPQPYIQGPSDICEKSTGQFSTTDAFLSYIWSNGTTLPTLEGPAGAYTVTVTDQNGCTGVADFNSQLIPLVHTQLSAPSEICQHQPFVVSATLQSTALDGIAWMSAANGATFSAPVQHGIVVPWTTQLSTTGLVQIDSVWLDGYNCLFEGLPAQAIVQVDNLAAIAQTEQFENGFSMLCPDDSGSITAVVEGGQSPFYYTWSTGNAGSNTLNGLAPGTYTVTVSGANGCTAVSTAQIVAPPALDVRLNAFAPLCEGVSDGKITIEYLSGQGDFSASVNGGPWLPAPENFSQLSPGVYNIQIEDRYCQWDTALSFPIPLHRFVEFSDSMVGISLGERYAFQTHTNAQIAHLQWYPPILPDPGFSIHPVVQPLTDTWYSLQITTPEGCIVQDQLLIRVKNNRQVYVPNAFMPGSSSENSICSVSAQTGAIHRLHMQIFDRWGNLVYVNPNQTPNDHGSGWDGRIGGQLAPPDSYAWLLQIEYIDGTVETRTGSVTVVR